MVNYLFIVEPHCLCFKKQLLRLASAELFSCQVICQLPVVLFIERVELLHDLGNVIDRERICALVCLDQLSIFVHFDQKALGIPHEDGLALGKQRAREHAKDPNAFDDLEEVKFLFHASPRVLVLREALLSRKALVLAATHATCEHKQHNAAQILSDFELERLIVLNLALQIDRVLLIDRGLSVQVPDELRLVHEHRVPAHAKRQACSNYTANSTDDSQYDAERQE